LKFYYKKREECDSGC